MIRLTTANGNYRYLHRSRISRGGVEINHFLTHRVFNSNQNKFIPLFAVDTILKEFDDGHFVYHLPLHGYMIGTGSRWSDVGRSLLQNPRLAHVIINRRHTDIYVGRGFATRITPKGEFNTLFCVATPNPSDILNAKKNGRVDQQEFYIVQSYDFINNPDYKNIRSQFRKIYINPLLEGRMDTIITHDIDRMMLRHIKLPYKFGSVDTLNAEFNRIKDSICIVKTEFPKDGTINSDGMIWLEELGKYVSPEPGQDELEFPEPETLTTEVEEPPNNAFREAMQGIHERLAAERVGERVDDSTMATIQAMRAHYGYQDSATNTEVIDRFREIQLDAAMNNPSPRPLTQEEENAFIDRIMNSDLRVTEGEEEDEYGPPF
jgi:hypothetical protein